MSVFYRKDIRAFGCVVMAALLSTAASAAPTVPPLVIGDVVVKIAPNTKIGKVRSGMLCTPNGDLRWYQVAMPSSDMVRERVAVALRAAGRNVLEDSARPEKQADDNRITLSVSIDGAIIRVCRAWKGMGNAPKGKGNLTLTWQMATATAGSTSNITVDEELMFDSRDPRMDAGVILDAIASSAVKYAGTTDTEK